MRPFTASFVPAWDTARDKIARHEWARALLAAARADFHRWKNELRIPGPDTPTRRYHTFFCHADGAKLLFDPRSPRAHACPRCGQVNRGDPWDGAWAMQMHNAAVAQLERALVLFKLGGADEVRDARAVFEEIVFHYANGYPLYPLHGDDPNCQGRVQPHRLNEAVWINGVLRVVRWSGLAGSWPAEVRDGLATMARLAAELLRPQVNAIHNHHTWLLAALAECAVHLRDEELLVWCRDSDFGMDAQIAQGFHDDGFWHEASTTYHYYTLESVLAYLDATGPSGLSGDAWRTKLLNALNNPPQTAYSDGRMPAYADGWLDTFLHTFAHVAENAWSLIGNQTDVAAYYRGEFPARVRPINGGPAPTSDDTQVERRASLAALLYGPDTLTESPAAPEPCVVMPDTGIAVLRNNRVRLGLRFGPDGGWHDHRDKLNVDIEAATGWRSLDLGTSGYGSDFTRWLRSPFAHNLIVVDDEPQPAHAGRLLSSSDHHIEAAAAFDGVHFSRSLRLTNGGWSDNYTVSLNRPRLLSWVFHGDGIFTPDAPASSATFTGKGGCSWLQNTRIVACEGGVLQGQWIHGDTRLRLRLPIPAGFTVWCAEAPGNAENRPMGVVIVRGHSAKESFRAEFFI